ncbi:MAG: hypothetical protein WBE37_22060 [Bryobacteraceae bacterium]
MVRHTLIATAFMIMFSAYTPTSAAAPQSAVPETVMVTYHAKPGSEAALANAIARQWAAATRLKLVLETPHTLVRGTEDGNTYFVEIFTWRDGNIPDAPPAAIQKIWAEMNQLVESQSGKPGIHFTAVSVVAQ